MSPAFFLCGCLRVAIPAAFTSVAVADPATGLDLSVPFGALVFATAIYDAAQRRRRGGRA